MTTTTQKRIAPRPPQESDALYDTETTRANCPACWEENGGCPGHCSICDDPIDYCQGHSPSDMRVISPALQ